MARRHLRPAAGPPKLGFMDAGIDLDLLARTEPPRRANGERKLAHNVFMQVTWGLLGVAALMQLFLLVWLDVTS